MKTVPFSDILAGVCQLVGLDRATLNDKSFGTIRDLTSRRISQVWDREEWPDTERFFSTFAGNPITSVELSGETILSEAGETMLMQNGSEILVDGATSDKLQIKLILDTDNFARVYLADFEQDAFKKGTVGKSLVKIVNPFYLTTLDNQKVSVGNNNYEFTYGTETDAYGKYIISVDIKVEPSTFAYPEYNGPNHPLTSKVVFLGNLNRLVLLEDSELQGLNAYNADPRNTTRVSNEKFLVEDFNDKNDISVGGISVNQEFSYLRFFTDAQKFISYRKPCISLSGIAYNPALSYSTGTQVYYDVSQNTSAYNPTLANKPTKGNFWTANVSTGLGVSPANSSANWSIVDIPYRFKDFLINGAAADFLRSEGRAEEANIFDSLAEASVQQQIDVLLRQQGQVRRINMAYTY